MSLSLNDHRFCAGYLLVSSTGLSVTTTKSRTPSRRSSSPSWTSWSLPTERWGQGVGTVGACIFTIPYRRALTLPRYRIKNILFQNKLVRVPVPYSTYRYDTFSVQNLPVPVSRIRSLRLSRIRNNQKKFLAFVNKVYVMFWSIPIWLLIKSRETLTLFSLRYRYLFFQLRILEVGGGSGANFKYFKVPAIVDIVGKSCHPIDQLAQKYLIVRVILWIS